jgi:hypothetical protein
MACKECIKMRCRGKFKVQNLSCPVFIKRFSGCMVSEPLLVERECIFSLIGWNRTHIFSYWRIKLEPLSLTTSQLAGQEFKSDLGLG